MKNGPLVQAASAELVFHAGGYLKNTVAKTGVTCPDCRTPITPEYDRCRGCLVLNRSGLQRADQRAFLTYAIQHTQSEKLMYNYKVSPPSVRHQAVVKTLVTTGFFGHSTCALAGYDGLTPMWATVPSLGGRAGEHPLAAITRSLVAPGLEVPLMAGKAADPRAFNPDHFVVPAPVAPDTHVILIDDTWAGGGHAESAGLALRRAGASRISILSLARMLNMSWKPNAPFVRQLPVTPFDPRVCPWTPTGMCPSR